MVGLYFLQQQRTGKSKGSLRENVSRYVVTSSINGSHSEARLTM